MDDFGCFAPPISQDGFFHDGSDFYVETEGARRRYLREEHSRLYTLLTYTEPPPVLTKKGTVAKRQPPPHKDPDAAFYTAQLLHYGLKPLKTKGPAKKALLAAFSADKSLQVPQKILDLERVLEARYAEVNKEAKEKYYRDKKLEEIEEEKRRQEMKKAFDADMERFLIADEEASNSEVEEVEPFDSEPTARDELHDIVANMSVANLRVLVGRLVDNPSLERVVSKEILAFSSKSKKTGKAKAVPVSKPKAKGSTKKLPHLELQGRFEISAPFLLGYTSNYESGQPMLLRLCTSDSSNRPSHLWGGFQLGAISGVIRSVGPPPTSIGAQCDFMWRGRESGEGVMTYGEENTGHIIFLGGGKIKGHMEWMGGFDFVGKKAHTPNVIWYKSVRQWKDEWRMYNDSSYNCENIARWGKWGGEPKKEGPMESDTTEAGSDDDEEEWSRNVAY